jgi:tetrahydromethanopterin S-methyltransferase subunit G
MENEAQTKILQLLDVISVEVAANRHETSELRTEMRAGFNRVDHRLGNLENRVENVEAELRVVQTDLRVVQTDLRIVETELRVVQTDLRAVESRLGTVETGLGSFRGEFERRIAPLER